MEEILKLQKRYVDFIIEQQGDMTNVEYAEKLGIDAARYSRLRNGKLYGIGIERIMRMVVAAGGEL